MDCPRPACVNADVNANHAGPPWLHLQEEARVLGVFLMELLPEGLLYNVLGERVWLPEGTLLEVIRSVPVEVHAQIPVLQEPFESIPKAVAVRIVAGDLAEVELILLDVHGAQAIDVGHHSKPCGDLLIVLLYVAHGRCNRVCGLQMVALRLLHSLRSSVGGLGFGFVPVGGFGFVPARVRVRRLVEHNDDGHPQVPSSLCGLCTSGLELGHGEVVWRHEWPTELLSDLEPAWIS